MPASTSSIAPRAPRPPAWSQGRQFGIVIDAGSSGSRIQVYSWLDPVHARRTRLVKGLSLDVLSRIEKGVEGNEGWQLKVEPGTFRFPLPMLSLFGMHECVSPWRSLLPSMYLHEAEQRSRYGIQAYHRLPATHPASKRISNLCSTLQQPSSPPTVYPPRPFIFSPLLECDY